eukprot:Blabericola_migrator_1__10018@NODE_554_length_7641_cov_83_757592_g417_i0_p1_GENE_NODE_554_length_7641_cov_83_757592_g417_i0NODE_554_length_7641_cov_83_757592_g417_i0_p1_ORF_typecomplete_len829_score160_56_NODE_554_length_7641_cov_83_757592_g417_i01842670
MMLSLWRNVAVIFLLSYEASSQDASGQNASDLDFTRWQAWLQVCTADKPQDVRPHEILNGGFDLDVYSTVETGVESSPYGDRNQFFFVNYQQVILSVCVPISDYAGFGHTLFTQLAGEADKVKMPYSEVCERAQEAEAKIKAEGGINTQVNGNIISERLTALARMLAKNRDKAEFNIALWTKTQQQILVNAILTHQDTSLIYKGIFKPTPMTQYYPVSVFDNKGSRLPKEGATYGTFGMKMKTSGDRGKAELTLDVYFNLKIEGMYDIYEMIKTMFGEENLCSPGVWSGLSLIVRRGDSFDQKKISFPVDGMRSVIVEGDSNPKMVATDNTRRLEPSNFAFDVIKTKPEGDPIPSTIIVAGARDHLQEDQHSALMYLTPMIRNDKDNNKVIVKPVLRTKFDADQQMLTSTMAKSPAASFVNVHNYRGLIWHGLEDLNNSKKQVLAAIVYSMMLGLPQIVHVTVEKSSQIEIAQCRLQKALSAATNDVRALVSYINQYMRASETVHATPAQGALFESLKDLAEAEGTYQDVIKKHLTIPRIADVDVPWEMPDITAQLGTTQGNKINVRASEQLDPEYERSMRSHYKNAFEETESVQLIKERLEAETLLFKARIKFMRMRIWYSKATNPFANARRHTPWLFAKTELRTPIALVTLKSAPWHLQVEDLINTFPGPHLATHWPYIVPGYSNTEYDHPSDIETHPTIHFDANPEARTKYEPQTGAVTFELPKQRKGTRVVTDTCLKGDPFGTPFTYPSFDYKGNTQDPEEIMKSIYDLTHKTFGRHLFSAQAELKVVEIADTLAQQLESKFTRIFPVQDLFGTRLFWDTCLGQ